MRLIFSRKGFDSQYGRVPSPVFPDGRFCSLPIPSSLGRPLADCRGPQGGLSALVGDLTAGKLSPQTLVHVDPDLVEEVLPRSSGWRPSFGQVGAAQSHLRHRGVGVGDVFLFYGWFRPVEQHSGRWRYVAKAASFHSLFGWLQVGEVIHLGECGEAPVPPYPWLADHPHIQHATKFTSTNNTLYLSAPSLSAVETRSVMPGAAMFRSWSETLRLSESGGKRSIWRMPAWMEPLGRPPLSYHGDQARWQRDDDGVRLRTAAKGQEFVLDAQHYPEAQAWLRQLIETCG